MHTNTEPTERLVDGGRSAKTAATMTAANVHQEAVGGGGWRRRGLRFSWELSHVCREIPECLGFDGAPLTQLRPTFSQSLLTPVKEAKRRDCGTARFT